MKLIVLGSGTCVPSLKRNAPGYYLEAKGRQVLVDCGSGTLLQLERAEKSYKDIDAVFITHLHPDHFADLMPLIHALLATPGFKRKKGLFVIGPDKFRDYYEKAIASVLGTPRDFSIHVIEIKDRLVLDPFRIFSAKTVHSHNSIAYRFEEGKKSLVFTGDSTYDEGIVKLSKDADLLVADCSFPHSLKTPAHLSSKECGLIAKEAGVKRLLLSHLYPADIPDTERIKECKEVFDGDVTLAEDLMEIEI
jgi:ribonuclease BN (tRNA processing enzyme)